MLLSRRAHASCKFLSGEGDVSTNVAKPHKFAYSSPVSLMFSRTKFFVTVSGSFDQSGTSGCQRSAVNKVVKLKQSVDEVVKWSHKDVVTPMSKLPSKELHSFVSIQSASVLQQYLRPKLSEKIQSERS